MNKFVLPTLFVCLYVMNGNVRWAVNGINEDTFKSNLPELGQFNETIPNLEDGEKLLREKCQKNSLQTNAFENAVKAKENFEVCVQSQIDVNVLKKEINIARPNGDVDMVFKKYCDKSPEFKKCVMNFTSTMDECLDAGEKESRIIIEHVSEALLSFMCHDDGTRIALFYANGGSDCLSNQNEGLKKCFNESVSKIMPATGNLSESSIPAFKFEEEQCMSMVQLKMCIVNELQHCDEPTSANIVESLFNFIRQSTPCSKFSLPEVHRSSSISLRSTIYLTAVGYSLSVLFGRFGH